jgi:hypothetical protein
MPVKAKPIAERFWSKVDRTGDCWLWLGSRHKFGYGNFNPTRNKKVGAHRVAWELTFGPVPEGLWVLHSCDNSPCCRPDHLFLGTPLDNHADMMAKNRQAKGDRMGYAKLTESQAKEVRRLRAEGASYSELGALFGITKQAAWSVVNVGWKYLPKEGS